MVAAAMLASKRRPSGNVHHDILGVQRHSRLAVAALHRRQILADHLARAHVRVHIR
jgi:hypothetical protein